MEQHQKLIEFLGDSPTQERLRQYFLTGVILGYRVEQKKISVQVCIRLTGGDWLVKEPGMPWKFVSECFN
jgi:hypothetical protein